MNLFLQMNEDLLQIRLSRHCIWPANAPDEFVLIVPGSLAEFCPDERARELIREAGYMVDCCYRSGTTGRAEYHVRRKGWQ